MTDNIAHDYAVKRLGPNYADALRVAGILRAGEKTPAIANEFADFGGYKQVRSSIEETVTAKQFRDAEATSRTVVEEWNKAMRESEGQSGFAEAAASGSTKDMVNAFGNASGQQNESMQAFNTMLKDALKLLEEKQKAPNDTARERIDAEAEAKLKASNEKFMADAAEQAGKIDALNLAAVIVVLGPEAVFTPGLYDAVVGR